MQRSLVLAITWLALLAPAASTMAQPFRRSAHLFPAATKGYLSILNSDAVRDRWSRTQFAELFDSPHMEAFREQVQARLDQRRGEMENEYGVNVDELLAVSAGEAAVAAIETTGEQITLVFLVEIGDAPGAADDLLRSAEARLTGQGAQRAELVVAGTPVVLYKVPRADALDDEVLYFVRDGMLGVGGDSGTVRTLLEQWEETEAGKLASLPAFRDTHERVAAADLQWKPPVVFFADPLRLDELLDPPEIQADGARRPTFANKHGFSAIQGIGGGVSLAENGLDVLYRLAVYAPPPHEKGMKILDFPTGNDFAPPAWAPDYLNSFSTFYWRLDSVIENIGPLFDDVAADDDLGAFDDIYRDVKNDLDVDLKTLFARLGPRVIASSDSDKNVSATSQRDLIAVEIKPGQDAAVAEEIARLFRDDPTVEEIELFIERREGNQSLREPHTLWRVGEARRLSDRDDRTGFTAAGVMVARGCLLIATNYKLLETKLLSPNSQFIQPKLADAAEFQDAMQRLDALGAGVDCARIFARTDRDFFTTYELLRRDRLDEAETIYGRAITQVLEQFDEAGTLDFAELPEFKEIAGFFGIAATSVKPQPTGWLLAGFVKPK
jgi:hypothetical protein